DHSGLYSAVRLQHMTQYGDPTSGWSFNGIAVAPNMQSNQFQPTLAPDGLGGVIVAWSDGRNGYWDIYAQRFTIGGGSQPRWTSTGVAVCTAAYEQDNATITSDQSGGCFIAWDDYRNGATTQIDIYAQWIDSTGTIGSYNGTAWAWNGVPVCTAGDYQVNA